MWSSLSRDPLQENRPIGKLAHQLFCSSFLDFWPRRQKISRPKTYCAAAGVLLFNAGGAFFNITGLTYPPGSARSGSGLMVRYVH